ncbi:MAG: hypothetical protein DRJ11_08320 [Candidatus Aminicenantes bacterium]|nr:MAG: hypothetical protein DRJ11_08320 [Candidatus Aminicenantes bacterium]
MLFVDLWGKVYSAAECLLVNIVSYTLFSFEKIGKYVNCLQLLPVQGKSLFFLILYYANFLIFSIFCGFLVDWPQVS